MHGFDGLRTRNASGGDASRDDSHLEEEEVKAQHRNKENRGGKSGSVRNKERLSDRDQNEACDTVSDAVSDDKCHQKNEHGN